MILKDILSEYEYVYKSLSTCKNFFDECDNLIKSFFCGVSSTMANHYSLLLSDPEKTQIINEIEIVFNESYDNIAKLVTYSYPLFGAMIKFEEYHFNVPALKREILYFLSSGHSVINVTNSIISSQSYGLRTGDMLSKLIQPLLVLVQHYHILLNSYIHLKDIDEELFENIPISVSASEKYNRIEIHSLKPSLNMDSFIEDLKNLSSFIDQFELIMTPENGSCRVYTQRIESGSLRIVWGSNTIELSGISEIIKALSEGIRIFRLTTLEKKIKNEETRTLKLENDEKELAIINSQIGVVAQITGLSSEKPEDTEKLQRLCLPLIRYLYSNPVGVIGDIKYDINNELKLIESVNE